MALIFKDWFFKQFPNAIQETDSYIDGFGEGLLRRYLRAYGVELDEEFMPYITTFVDIIDIESCPDKYLPLLATLLGNPATPDTTPAIYRKVLAYAIQIYKVKGTAESFQLMGNLLGLSLTIVEATPRRRITYDNKPSMVSYDQGHIYDSTDDYCSAYWLGYSSTDDTTSPFTQNAISQVTLDKIQRVLCFLQPINAIFAGFIPAARFRDVADITLNDSNTTTIS